MAPISTARVRPSPICGIGEQPPLMKAPDTTARSSAAQVTTGPDRRRPVTTASRPSPVRTQASRIRARTNSS
ncbi:hypothetical protein STENM36S_08664 [Streptomyces tendae]